MTASYDGSGLAGEVVEGTGSAIIIETPNRMQRQKRNPLTGDSDRSSGPCQEV